MKVENGRKLFGFWDNMPYGDPSDSFKELSKIKNTISKNEVVKHIETLVVWATSSPTYDMFTGEKLQAGVYDDGDFTFPLDFLHYYKNYDIGIPLEYEEYLKSIL